MKKNYIDNGKQKGSSLIVVMIVLIILLSLSMALSKSSSVTSKVLGGISNKNSLESAGDVGLYQAKNYIYNLADYTAITADKHYYPTELSVDGDGVPTGGGLVKWTGVGSIVPSTVNGFSVQYVIDRMCTAPIVTVKADTCFTSLYFKDMNSSVQVGQSQIVRGPEPIYYRITVRVVGNKGAESFVQALVAS